MQDTLYCRLPENQCKTAAEAVVILRRSDETGCESQCWQSMHDGNPEDGARLQVCVGCGHVQEEQGDSQMIGVKGA